MTEERAERMTATAAEPLGRVRTNRVPRYTVDASELTVTERAEFDYIEWPLIDSGQASASFVRYKGRVYDLADCEYTAGLPEFHPLREWDGFWSDSYFSAVCVRFVGRDYEVVVGTFTC